jgi:hypothetical protein
MLRYTYIACLLLFAAVIIFKQCTTQYTLTARSLSSLLYDYPCTRMLYLLENRWEPNGISPLDINTVLSSMLHVSCTYTHRALFHTFRLYEEHPPISKHESLYVGSSAKITSLCYILQPELHATLDCGSRASQWAPRSSTRRSRINIYYRSLFTQSSNVD